MRYQIIWSESAEQQINKIFEFYLVNFKYYLSRASMKVAKKIVRTLLLKAEDLLIDPFLGPQEELLYSKNEKYRYLLSSNYKIIYSVDEENKLIKIADVFDIRQNPLKLHTKQQVLHIVNSAAN